MKTQNTFDVLLLIARPGTGQSGLIGYHKNTPYIERIARFHGGEMDDSTIF